jgi:hypothetical protein
MKWWRSGRTGIKAAALLAAMTLLGGTAATARGEDKADEKKRVLEIGKWYPSLEAGLSMTQSSYTDNWRGGDKGSVVWTALAQGGMENQLHPKANWNNTIKLAFGQTHQQQERVGTHGRYWSSPLKSTDLLDFESLVRFTLGGYVDPFFGVRAESQFLDAADADGRTLKLNPWRFKESAGIARKWVDEKDRNYQSRLGFTFRQGMRRYYAHPAPDQRTKSEMTNDGGFEFVTDAKTSVLSKRVAWTAKLTLYQPVFYSGKTDLQDAGLAALAAHAMRLDADFENLFTSQVTKILSVQLYTRWLYDQYDNSVKPVFKDLNAPTAEEERALRNAAVRQAGQFKQTLGIGLTYRFL